MPRDSTAGQSGDTRSKILRSAFGEFYQSGFHGGSLGHIVEAASATKGALFHYFAGKQALGYAVVDEIIGPLLMQRWLDPLVGSADPITDMQDAFRKFIDEDIRSGAWVFGCPLNNLAQEMSPLDEGFRWRIEALYARWRLAFANALAAGVAQGTIRGDTDPENVAAFIVVSQMGIWGTGKYSQDEALMTSAGEALCAYLESLRAPALGIEVRSAVSLV